MKIRKNNLDSRLGIDRSARRNINAACASVDKDFDRALSEIAGSPLTIAKSIDDVPLVVQIHLNLLLIDAAKRHSNSIEEYKDSWLLTGELDINMTEILVLYIDGADPFYKDANGESAYEIGGRYLWHLIYYVERSIRLYNKSAPNPGSTEKDASEVLDVNSETRTTIQSQDESKVPRILAPVKIDLAILARLRVDTM